MTWVLVRPEWERAATWGTRNGRKRHLRDCRFLVYYPANHPVFEVGDKRPLCFECFDYCYRWESTP